jgi:hypothetical protein
MATRVTNNGTWKVESAKGSVEIMSSPDGKPLMTEPVAAGSPMSEVLQRAFLKFGAPEHIVTDGGLDFASKSVSDVLASFGVKQHIKIPTRGSNRSGL